jgi:hypothetical protein
MESPHSQTAAQPRSVADYTAHPSDTSSFFEHDETKTWKDRAGRFVKPWKRTKRVANTDVTANVDMDTAGAGPLGVTAPDSVHNNNNHNDNETAPSASSSSSRPPRRRRYIDGWVRYPKNSSSTSNPSSTSTSTIAPPGKIKDAYRIALKDRLVRKHLVICAVSGLLLLMLISLCTFPLSFSTLISGLTANRPRLRHKLHNPRRTNIPYILHPAHHDLRHGFLPFFRPDVSARYQDCAVWLHGSSSCTQCRRPLGLCATSTSDSCRACAG